MMVTRPNFLKVYCWFQVFLFCSVAVSQPLPWEIDSVELRARAYGLIDPTFENENFTRVPQFDSSKRGGVSKQFSFSTPAINLGFDNQNRLLIGHRIASGITFYRRHSNGTLDTAFGTAGSIMSFFGGDAMRMPSFRTGRVETSDKIVLAGQFHQPVAGPINQDFFLSRLRADGVLDTSFATTGWVFTSFGTNFDFLTSLALQTDGKILAAGTSADSTSSFRFAVARYTTNGNLDATFGTGGTRVLNFSSGDDIGYGLAIQTNGAVLLAGQYGPRVGPAQFLVVRLTSAGSLDTSFATNGYKIYDASLTGHSVARAVHVQNDETILVLGSKISSEVALVSLHSDGSFGTSGSDLGNYEASDQANLSGTSVSFFAGASFLYARNTDFTPFTYLGTTGFLSIGSPVRELRVNSKGHALAAIESSIFSFPPLAADFTGGGDLGSFCGSGSVNVSYDFYGYSSGYFPSAPNLPPGFSFLGGSFPGSGGSCISGTVPGYGSGSGCSLFLDYNASGLGTGTIAQQLEWELQTEYGTMEARVPISGLSQGPGVTVSGGDYDFGLQPVSLVAQGASVNVLANTPCPADVYLDLYGPMAISSGASCGLSALGTGNSYVISGMTTDCYFGLDVTFPGSSGNFSGQMSFSGAGVNSGSYYYTGTACVPSFVFPPSPIDLGTAGTGVTVSGSIEVSLDSCPDGLVAAGVSGDPGLQFVGGSFPGGTGTCTSGNGLSTPPAPCTMDVELTGSSSGSFSGQLWVSGYHASGSVDLSGTLTRASLSLPKVESEQRNEWSKLWGSVNRRFPIWSEMRQWFAKRQKQQIKDRALAK